MKRKLIFLDIDGTLTPAGNNNPPESAMIAVKAAQAKGHKVFLCTGRNPAMLAPVLALGFDGVLNYYALRNAVCDLDFERAFCDFVKNSELVRWRKALADQLNIRPMSEYDGSPIYKIVFMCREAKQLQPARDALERQYHFVVQDVAAHHCLNGELINRKYDKGKGVRIVAEHYGMDIADTIGFGDSMNDLEMIETVGCSVCMANGSPALQAKSDLVCPAVEEDGLYKAFEQLELM